MRPVAGAQSWGPEQQWSYPVPLTLIMFLSPNPSFRQGGKCQSIAKCPMRLNESLEEA